MRLHASVPRGDSSTGRSRSCDLQALAVAIALLVPGMGHAQVPDPKPWATDGPVYAVAVAGGTIYLGGDFHRIGPNTPHFAAREVPGGAIRAEWPKVDGTVYCSAPDGAGGVFIGGAFTAVNGQPRGGLAHIRADG